MGKAWNAANPEKQRAYSREYHRRNRVRMAASARAWYAENMERALETSRLYREENPVLVKDAGRRTRMAHPNTGRESYEAYRARKAGATVETVDRTVVFTRDAGLCGICTAPVNPESWHLDHVIPLARGGAHSYANTQVSHPTCNLQKGAR